MPATIKKISEETFIKRVISFIGKKKVSYFDSAEDWSSYRFNHVISAIMRRAYQDKVRGIPYRYNNIAYGIRWSADSGRVNGETIKAMRALNVSELVALVYEVGEKFDNIGDIPVYLMKKYTKVEEKVLQ